jgi:2-oxoglutarate ferredoxin oxidoreductase subunit gamma
MLERIIIAGAGGQGIMLLGKIIAESAMREGRHVSWFPSYGAEVRGGTAYCMVVISDKEIASPYVQEADTLFVFNQPSWEKFKSRAAGNALLIVNSSLANPGARGLPRAFCQPFSEVALGLGNIKVANVAALGYYLRRKKMLSPKTVNEVMRDFAPRSRKDLLKINQQALKAGMKLRDERQ